MGEVYFLGLDDENGKSLVAITRGESKGATLGDIEFRYKRAKLKWIECCPFIWQAASRYHDDRVPFMWRIDENDFGSYEIINSTPELISCLEQRVFDSLEEAKAFCEEEEAFSVKGKWITEDEITVPFHKDLAWKHARVVKGVRLYPPPKFEAVVKEWGESK